MDDQKALSEYVATVRKHTVLLLAGVIGVVLLVISIALGLSGVSSPKVFAYIGLALVFVALSTAQFLVWRDMRTERDEKASQIVALTDALRDKLDRQMVRERLSYNYELGDLEASVLMYASERFNDELKKLREEHADQETIEKRLTPLMTDDSIQSVREWAKRVGEMLETFFDRSKRKLFESNVDIQPPPVPDMMESYYGDIWQNHQIRLIRLHRIIEELQD